MKVAILQFDMFWENIGDNLMLLNNLLAELDSKTELLVLPEMFQTGFSMNPYKLAEESNGNTLNWMHQLSQATNMAVCGSWMVREDGNYYNRFHFISPDGLIYTYDKMKLFTLGKEQLHFTPGKYVQTFEYKGWRICPQICYDLRFPEIPRSALPFDILIYVASWPERRINAWTALLQARSIENQCYVVAVNRVGEDGEGVNHAGMSCVYGFDGTKLADAGSQVDIFYVELDKTAMDAYRKTLPFLDDRSSITLD